MAGSKAAPAFCLFSNSTIHSEYDFLSNFHEHPLKWVVADGGGNEVVVFHTPEGCYQWLKCCAGGMARDDPVLRAWFQQATGQQAWDRVHVDTSFVVPSPDLVTDAVREDLMASVLQCKFADGDMGPKLLATESAYLAENGAHDRYWADGGDGTGANRLGNMLMELRGVMGGVPGVPVPGPLATLYAEAARATCSSTCTSPGHISNAGVVFNRCGTHMDRVLTLGSKSIQLPLSAMPDGTGRFLYFNLNALPEFVDEGAWLVCDAIQKSVMLAGHASPPLVVLPETSTIALAHVLATKFGMECVLVPKTKKPSDVDVVSVTYCAATSTAVKTMYLGRDELRARMKDGPRPIYFVDNVCTTGETLRALFKLMCECGVADCVAGAVVLFTEGADVKSIEVAPGVSLSVTRFTHIPIYPRDPAGDGPLYALVSTCKLPTTFGPFTMHVFEHRTLSTEAVVLCSLDTLSSREGVLLRVHDACLTSEVFGSCKCDCKLQLEQAQARIAADGGLIIYLKQEGRGIGLAKKIQAYGLQESRGLDTVQANRELGLPDDMREYTAVRDILRALCVDSVRLLSNNPRKAVCLQELGVRVAGCAPCVVEPKGDHMRAYMRAKKDLMGHTITTV